MNKLLSFLDGKKTFLCALGVAVVTLCHQFGYLNSEVTNTLLMLLGAGSVASLRAAVAKMQ